MMILPNSYLAQEDQTQSLQEDYMTTQINISNLNFVRPDKANLEKDGGPAHLPSSHSGGELPGNHRGLSGGSGWHTLDTPLVACKRVGDLEQALVFPGTGLEACTLPSIIM